jgi:hypothetical protein
MGGLMLAASLAVSLRGVDATGDVLREESSRRALALAHSCAEEAIVRVRMDPSYGGPDRVLVDGADACDIIAVRGSGASDRIVESMAIVNGYVKRVEVDLAEIVPSLSIRSWHEVVHFSSDPV